MRSVTFSAEAEIDVDIYDVWDQMREEDKEEFLKKEGLTQLSSRNCDEWQDFVYMLNDEEVKNIMRWMNFYNKIGKNDE